MKNIWESLKEKCEYISTDLTGTVGVLNTWYTLTQCGLVKPYGDMDLGQHWLVPDMNQWHLWHLHKSNSPGITRKLNLYIEFEKYIFKITATCSRGEWVKTQEAPLIPKMNQNWYFSVDPAIFTVSYSLWSCLWKQKKSRKPNGDRSPSNH